MKNVDKLLRKARTLLDRIVDALFPDNEDGFLDCLGVDPEKYKRTHADGTFGYDFLAAIADTAKEDWENWDEDIPATVFTGDSSDETDIQNEPWKYPCWNSLTKTEKREILFGLGIKEESIENFMEYAEKQPKQEKGKNYNLFGWG